MRAQNEYVYFGIEVEKIITLSILLTESTWFIANTQGIFSLYYMVLSFLKKSFLLLIFLLLRKVIICPKTFLR